MGNGAMALANEYHLNPGERKLYQKPYLELKRQGRHPNSIKKILADSLIKQRALQPRARPASSGERKLQPYKRQGDKVSQFRTINLDNELSPKDDPLLKFIRSHGNLKMAKDAVAITGKPYHHDRAKKFAAWKAALHEEQVLKWKMLLSKMKWSIAYKMVNNVLFPYAVSMRRVPLSRFRRVDYETVRVMPICRTLNVCIILHDDYEERKYLPGLSSIIEVVASLADCGCEVQPRLYLAVNLLQSILSESIIHEVHLQMASRTTRAVPISEAARAIADASRASVIGLVKSVTVTAAIDSHGASESGDISQGANARPTTASAKHITRDIVPLERSRFAVWLDKTQNGRLSISKTASASVELVRGIRRGTRSYSVILASLNGVIANDCEMDSSKEDTGTKTQMDKVNFIASKQPSQSKISQGRENSQFATDHHHFINSIVYNTIVKYILANLTLQAIPPSQLRLNVKDGSSDIERLGPAAKMKLGLAIVVDESQSQEEMLRSSYDIDDRTLLPPKASISASTSQKEVLFVSDQIVRRFIAPARVIPIRGRRPSTVDLNFPGVMEKFSNAALAARQANRTAASLANISVSTSVLDATLPVRRHKLASSTTIPYAEISETLNAMLERRLREDEETEDTCSGKSELDACY